MFVSICTIVNLVHRVQYFMILFLSVISEHRFTGYDVFFLSRLEDPSASAVIFPNTFTLYLLFKTVGSIRVLGGIL